MDFDDSLFSCGKDDGERGLETNKKASSTVSYTAKICYPGWFNELGGGADDEDVETSGEEAHVILKYKADFYYSWQNFQKASDVYVRILEMLPSTNRVVQREVEDSLARCHLGLGQFSEALSHAETLLTPPHENDALSWQLLAECYKGLGTPYLRDHMICLQKSILAVRYNTKSWLELADTYLSLSTESSTKLESIFESSCSINSSQNQQQRDDVIEKLETIFSNTITLFRPYFKWSEEGIIRENISLVSRLLGRQNSVRNFIGHFNLLPRKQAKNLMQTFCEISHQSCLIWARHLQLYTVRHSNSFARQFEQERLEKIELSLASRKDKDVCDYLTQCFNHPSIFDDSS